MRQTLPPGSEDYLRGMKTDSEPNPQHAGTGVKQHEGDHDVLHLQVHVLSYRYALHFLSLAPFPLRYALTGLHIKEGYAGTEALNKGNKRGGGVGRYVGEPSVAFCTYMLLAGFESWKGGHAKWA